MDDFITLGHFQWYPDGGTFVVPAGVEVINVRLDLPLDFNPFEDELLPEYQWKEHKVRPGDTVIIYPRQQVGWIDRRRINEMG